MDPDPSAMKEQLISVIEECTDSLLLDLFYKVLIYYNFEGQSE